MYDSDSIKITGLGLCLPETLDGKSDLRRVQSTLRSGQTRLRFSDQHSPLHIWAAIDAPDTTGLRVSKKHLSKYSNATLLAAQAARLALSDAAIFPGFGNLNKIEMIVGSTMFGADALNRQKCAIVTEEYSGLDYMLQGTPGSLTSGLALLNGLDVSTITLTGSCVLGATLLTLAAQRLSDPGVEAIIIVGVDSAYSPLLAKALTYRLGTNRDTMAYIGKDPTQVRPLDKYARGSGWGDGAVAMVLQRANASKKPVLPPFRLCFRTGRSNGTSPIGSGPAKPFAEDVLMILHEAGLTMSEIPVWLDFCEGTPFIQNYFSQILTEIRELAGYDGIIRLSNCEASYGHIGAVTVLLKLISGLSMAQERVVYPAACCQQPDPAILATPILKAHALEVPRFIILSGGSGGDRAVLLVEIDRSERRWLS